MVSKKTNPITKDGPTHKRLIIVITAAVFFTGILIYHLNSKEFSSSNKVSTTPLNKRIPFPAPTDSIHQPKVKFEDFVGSQTCATCHQDIYNQWKGSTHGKAGGQPNATTIFAKFDGKERRFKDASFIPYINSKNEYMFRLKIDELPPEEYKVDVIVGGGHMVGGGTQTFFSKFPDGTYRFLPFDFIRDEQVWFGETDQGQGWIPISPDLPVSELSEWPPARILGAHTSFDNCQQCHGSQILIEYNFNQKKYETKFTGLDINCESCHGPGKKHLEIMTTPDNEDVLDIGMTALSTLDTEKSLKVCFSCHALKDILQTGYLPGDDLEEYYALKLPILGENPYHPDGRIKAFGYQQNHLHSDCYVNGSMTCVSCHDPHSQSYRDIYGQVLTDRFDDRQCTSCHESKTAQPELHSFHKPDSPGNKCVACHMPYLQHQAMGKELRFSRSDHTIAIPRPAFDASLGIENACSQCHKNESIEFLQTKTEEWYGTIKPHDAKVASLNHFRSGMDRQTAADLLLNDSSYHEMAHMAGLTQFLSDYLQPNMNLLEPGIVDQIKKFVDSKDIDIKSTALASLHLAKDLDNDIHNYLVKKLTELSPSDEAKVRARWATVLPFLGKNYEQKGSPQQAIIAYSKALEIQPSNTAIRINLGTVYESTGDYDKAIQQYTAALNIDQDNENGWINLGNVFLKKGDQAKALISYQEAIKINSWNSVAHFNIGNYHFRSANYIMAIAFYQKAIEADPGLALANVYLSLSYIEMKQYRLALVAVIKGLKVEPENEMGLEIFNLLANSKKDNPQ